MSEYFVRATRVEIRPGAHHGRCDAWAALDFEISDEERRELIGNMLGDMTGAEVLAFLREQFSDVVETIEEDAVARAAGSEA